jgi:dienelactone hydrolase
MQEEHAYDGLHVEKLSWQLPYGPPTKAILLKPKGAKGPLPGILALHDHGGNKYFGRRKITETSSDQHSLIEEHQRRAYGGRAWANEVARRGYVVLVPDAFAFASRRVRLQNVLESIRGDLPAGFEHPEQPKNIKAYNRWASGHESIMAKSLSLLCRK